LEAKLTATGARLDAWSNRQGWSPMVTRFAVTMALLLFLALLVSQLSVPTWIGLTLLVGGCAYGFHHLRVRRRQGREWSGLDGRRLDHLPVEPPPVSARKRSRMMPAQTWVEQDAFTTALAGLEKRLNGLNHRIQAMESEVTKPSFDWDSRLRR
jgi:hypothetical protein